MNRDEFWKYYNDKEFDKLQSVFNDGTESQFGFDIDIYVKQASWSEDFEQLYFLWKNGAKALTPYIAEIYDKFSKGETAKDMVRAKEIKRNDKLKKVKADLTNYESVNQLPIDQVYFNTNKKNETYLIITFAPFTYNEMIFDSESCLFGPLSFTDLGTKNRFDFSASNFNESIYLFNVHNPVNLLEIEFQDAFKNEIKVKIILQFDFEFEANRKNELLTLETTTHKNVYGSLGFSVN
jgi:hypothetical protein